MLLSWDITLFSEIRFFNVIDTASSWAGIPSFNLNWVIEHHIFLSYIIFGLPSFRSLFCVIVPTSTSLSSRNVSDIDFESPFFPGNRSDANSLSTPSSFLLLDQVSLSPLSLNFPLLFYTLKWIFYLKMQKQLKTTWSMEECTKLAFKQPCQTCIYGTSDS